jgi:hypothetical protein
MLNTRKQLLFILFIFSIYINGTAQTTFNSIINDDLYTSGKSIVNGIAWNNSVAYQGNRFCGSTKWKDGTVLFNGRLHSGLKINYDVLEDELILFDETPGAEKYIQLNKELIKQFSYTDKNTTKIFVYKELNLSKGKEIYEEVYKGEVSFYIKHKKSVKKEIGTVYMGKLYDNNTLYLQDAQQSYSFKNKKNILHILGDSEELKTFIRKENLRIHKNYPNDIVRLLVYHQSLTKTN